MGGVAPEKRAEPSPEARRRAATELIESHDSVFRRTARRYSICADDADDAYQRALEILLTKAPAIEKEALVRWMQTVTKREALAVRRQRERLLGSPRKETDEDQDRDPLDSIAADQPDPDDRAVRRERVAQSGEALRALKPQEIRALTLKAEGYSYEEIREITGWTYTKVNRCMAEGRKRFLQVFADIEEGRRCEHHLEALSALADGELGVAGAEDVHLHLRGCGSCRAKLRAFRAIPQKVLELMPAGPALEQSTGGRASEWLGERAAATAEKAREVGYALMNRGAGESAGQLAASGGTRGAGMAALGKVLAVCGATAAGSAACVATGVVQNPLPETGASPGRPAMEQPARPVEAPVSEEVVVAEPPRADVVSDAATAGDLSPGEQSNRDFGFESSAEAPATSSTEFGGPAGGSAGSGGSGGSSGGGGFGFER